MKRLKFFDSNVCYGPQKVLMPGVDYSLSALLRRMEEFNIEKALVLHSIAREHDASFGNARLMEEIKGHDNLLPVWALMPHHTGEMDAPDMLTARMIASFIIAHMGGAPDVLEHAIDTLIAHDNVFGDTALPYAPHRGVEYIVRRAGAEKLLFGSDMPFYDPVFMLARVVSADIHESEIEKIAGGNFKQICPKAAE